MMVDTRICICNMMQWWLFGDASADGDASGSDGSSNDDNDNNGSNAFAHRGDKWLRPLRAMLVVL
ncbi:MAG TPA: hypothetical protein VIY08_03450 [Candidatus Nitrosocosmicus sp.]